MYRFISRLVKRTVHNEFRLTHVSPIKWSQLGNWGRSVGNCGGWRITGTNLPL